MNAILRTLTFTLSSLLASRTQAQLPFDEPTWTHQHFTRKTQAMTVLTGWGTTNVLIDGIGALTSDDQQLRQFHLMNAGWGAVNATLGILGRRSARKDRNAKLPINEAYADLRRTEKILLFNAGLDLAYIIGGAYVLQRAELQDTRQPERLRGFGKSIMLQGAALLAFDLLAYRHIHPSEVELRVGRGGISLVVPIK